MAKLDVAKLKARARELGAKAQANPKQAIIVGLSAIFVLLLFALVLKLMRGPAEPEGQLLELDADTTTCGKLHKLAMTEQGKKGGLSAEYIAALGAVHRQLFGEEPAMSDAVALAQVSCQGLSDPDIAWLVVIETQVSRGVWPNKPSAPPANDKVRAALHDALAKQPKLAVSLSADDATRQAWLAFAVAAPDANKDPAAPLGPILAALWPESATTDESLALYQRSVVLGAPAEWLTARLYAKLGLLPEPVYVEDAAPPSGAPSVQRGPDNTLAWLGLIDGGRCAVAFDTSKFPALWVRPCTGLTPVRVRAGELLLLGVPVKADSETPMRWLPVLARASAPPVFAKALRDHVSDQVLGSFIVGARRYLRTAKLVAPFAPELQLTPARLGEAGETFAAFKTEGIARLVPSLLVFGDKSDIKLAAKCPKIPAKRCEPIKGTQKGDRCEVTAAECIHVGGGAQVRFAPVRIIRPEPCIEEVGEKTDCRFTELYGAFVDVQAPGKKAFDEGPFVLLHTRAPASP